MTSAPSERHLVSVWNPTYAANAIEEHLAVLLDFAKRVDGRTVPDEALYVWWGKVRSPNRQQPQAHAEDIRAIGGALARGERDEVQLYLTDYRSLYVGDVAEIRDGALDAGENEHVPGYYAHESLVCDFWFRLQDIRRLVSDDMIAVIAELKKLRNVLYGDRPVSLYGGMVDLPLLVTRPDRQRFFDEDERDALTGERLWAEFDAERGLGVGAIERELRENRFWHALWGALEPTTRTFIATAEQLYRTHRHDPAFDFGPVLTAFAKALEVQCNTVLRRGLRGAPPEARRAHVGNATIDVTVTTLSLGQLARALYEEHALNAALRARLVEGAWFGTQLPAVLATFAEERNPGAHSTRVDEKAATRWRERLLGVGCEGDLVTLAKVQTK